MKNLAALFALVTVLGAFAWSASKAFAPPDIPYGCSQARACAAALSGASRTVMLSIPGMTCAACPITIKNALSKIEGVNRVSVMREKREVIVSFDQAKTNVQTVRQACEDAGYPATVKP